MDGGCADLGLVVLGAAPLLDHARTEAQTNSPHFRHIFPAEAAP